MKNIVGLTANNLDVTLTTENCTQIDDSIPDTIHIGHQFTKNHVFSKKVLIFKKESNKSTCVRKNQATGALLGTLRFCVLVEILTEDGVSVSFQKKNVQLTYNLTTNMTGPRAPWRLDLPTTNVTRPRAP